MNKNGVPGGLIVFVEGLSQAVVWRRITTLPAAAYGFFSLSLRGGRFVEDVTIPPGLGKPGKGTAGRNRGFFVLLRSSMIC